MPNGGSDCCGTCWFNRKNEGEPGYHNADKTGEGYCEIRDVDLDESPTGAFYTYCANHPHRNPQKLTVPLGPVFTGDSLGQREIWKASPDSEEIRRALLDLLASMPEQPTEEYPLGLGLDEVVILQLAEFRERRAIGGLERILGFESTINSGGSFPRDRAGTIQAAKRALASLHGTSPPAED